MPKPRTTGFPPILGQRPRVLILGSLPSQLSLRHGEYYGNPQNAFWSIMGELFGAGPDLSYAERISILAMRGIAVWDVLANSVRPGSLDSAIDKKSAVINDFERFFLEQSEIRWLCFNGQAAGKIFMSQSNSSVRAFVEQMECVTLPSTSPAHASMSFAEKLKHWSIVSTAIERKDDV